MTAGRAGLSRWTALFGAVLLGCAVLLFQIAHATAAPPAFHAMSATAMPCHEAPSESGPKAAERHVDRSCAMHCSALFLPSLPPASAPVFTVPHESGRSLSLSSREPPAPERPPKV